MAQPTIIYLTHSEPQSIGNGGNHRSYQVHHDLQQLISAGEIHVFVRPNQAGVLRQNVPPRAPSQQTRWTSVKHRAKMLFKRVRAARENPFYLVTENNFSIDSYLSSTFLADYERAVREARPQIAIFDHIGFAPIIAINQKYGVRTLACPQNLEALDVPIAQNSRWGLSAMAHNWAQEVAILGQCDGCLCISKVEMATLRGLGYSADYYAYQPVGEIDTMLSRIRQARQTTPPERGLFLMPGSAFHHSTRDGMLWLLHQIEAHHLPADLRIVIIGAQSHTLPSVAGVTAHGWIDQDQLEHYLTTTEGILIPQFRGFGASTKLIEFARAGLPIIASEYITFAVDPLPQVRVVPQQWEAWVQAMQMTSHAPVASASLIDTQASEARLVTLVRQLLQ